MNYNEKFVKICVVRSFLFLFIFIFNIALSAQEETFFFEEPDIETEIQLSSDEPLTPAMRRAEMEIKTSTLSELALWCRTLGLSESGTREELSQRLRQHFQLPDAPPAADDRRIITIESAQAIEYFTIDAVNEDYARLKGNVSISLIEGNTLHRISADEILFNRTRNIVSARGQVVYVKTDDDTIETFRGENITVNLDTWSSILLDGSSSRELESDGTAYLFSGAVISRNDEDVTVINKARITNAANPDALWSINASRLWLLPGSDFAVLNAVLKVGEIPVLYIPFFYFPGDTLFFHPVIGYRSREGGFVQTTTYLIGQPRSDPDETSSISRILGNSNNMEREREGLFLRSTGKKIINPDELSLKFIFDYYVNLGFYAGVDLAAPKTGSLNPLTLSAGIGFSRTVTNSGGFFTPYAPLYDGSFDWNYSNLFSMQVPFRYRMNFQSSITAKYGSFHWNLPFFSDPFVNRDFLNRSETMDLFSMMQQRSDTVSSASAVNENRSYMWHINGNINPVITKANPYITRLSITNISSTLSFKSLIDNNVSSDSPNHEFYAPDRFTIYNISGIIAGTPLSVGGTRPSQSGESDEINDPLNGIGTPISPWSENEDPPPRSPQQDLLVPPAISQNFSLPAAGNLNFNINYQITPSSSSELQFISTERNWKTNKDVNWGDVQSVLSSFSGSANISFNLNHTSGLFSNTFTFSGSGTIRDYGYLNEEAFLTSGGQIDNNRIEAVKRQQYSQTNYSTFYAYNGTLRPFRWNQIFSQTNFQYNFRGTLVRSRRWNAANSPDGPDFTPQWGSWVKDIRTGAQDTPGLTSHRVSANIAANIMDFQQNVSLSADLPPLDLIIITAAAFRFSISETTVNFRMEGPGSSSDRWVLKPVYLTETIKLNNSISFIYSMVIKPEENNDITNISASLSLWNFKASFSAEKSLRYNFTPAAGWQEDSSPQALYPKELLFSYSGSFPQSRLIKDSFSLSLNVNTSLSFNLQRYTNSNFQITLGASLFIPGFLELTFSATSKNSSIWRYYMELPGVDPSSYQNNVFLDLADSFNFFDEQARRRSAFKIQRLEFKALHFLGDWTAELGVSMYPSLINQKYQITADFHFIVAWRPISEIRSDIKYDGKNSTWGIR